MSHPGSHTAFIPSIEGMRALAVIVVLLFHLEALGLEGGFLGVDLFFVISGFIITRNILSDLRTSEFSLAGFYLRRFRRLFPALIVVVFATLVVGLAVVPPGELEQTAQSSIYALFSVANIHFWLQSGYFDALSDTKPLLHTWSLGVEEQFYLLWPAVLLFVRRLKTLIVLICLLIVVSMGASYVFHGASPDAVFYLMPFRVHQLMAGALLSTLILRLDGIAGEACAFVATVGFIMLVVLIVGEERFFLGAIAVSGLGAMLLLSRESRFSELVYSNSVMIWIGKRSYALYLVHWPVIVLYKYHSDFMLSSMEKVGLAAVCIILTVALHEWVEKPFRMSREDSTPIQKAALPGTVFALLATVFLAANLWGYEGIRSRINPQIEAILKARHADRLMRLQRNQSNACNVTKASEVSTYSLADCARIQPGMANALVFGDSLGDNFSQMVKGRFPNVNVLIATTSGCPPLITIRGGPGWCSRFIEFAFSEILNPELDLVVLVARWENYPNIVPKLVKTVEYLQAMDIRVLVIGPRANFDRSPHLILAMQNSPENLDEKIGKYMRVETELLNEMRSAMPHTRVFDMASIQCTPTCNVVYENKLLYNDHVHFSEAGADYFGEKFENVFDIEEFLGIGRGVRASH